MMKISTLPALIFLMTVFSFAACAQTDADPSGEWRLVAYGASASPTPAIPGVETSISFSSDGKFGGNVGCNSLGGEYKINSDGIHFDSIFSTMMFCEQTSKQESAVINILSGKTLTFSISGDQMTLVSKDGLAVIKLSRK